MPMKTVHHKLGLLWQQAMRGPTDQRGWTVHLDPFSHRDLECDPEARHGGDLDMVWRDENRGAWPLARAADHASHRHVAPAAAGLEQGRRLGDGGDQREAAKADLDPP